MAFLRTDENLHHPFFIPVSLDLSRIFSIKMFKLRAVKESFRSFHIHREIGYRCVMLVVKTIFSVSSWLRYSFKFNFDFSLFMSFTFENWVINIE